MSDYQITKTDIYGMMRYLEVYHPDRANRDYALALLEYTKSALHEIAQFFGVLFNQMPRYSEINPGNPALSPLHLCFEATKKTQESLESLVVISRRIELRLPG